MQDLPLGSGLGSGLSAPALGGLLLARCGPVSSISIPAGARGSSLRSESTSGCARNLPLAGEAIGNSGGTDLVGAGNLGLLDTSAVLVLLGLGVAVEVQIGHDVPLSLTGSESATEAEDLTGKHPPDETNGVAALVVGGDGNIDVLGWGITVAESLMSVSLYLHVAYPKVALTMTGMLT